MSASVVFNTWSLSIFYLIFVKTYCDAFFGHYNKIQYM